MFKKITHLFLLSLGCCLFLMTYADTNDKPEYKLLTVSPPAFLKVSSNHPTVLEFFSYGCPHCYHTAPAMEKWINDHQAKINAGKINFRQIPVAWNGPWKTYMKAYEVARALKQLPKFNDKIFSVAQNPLLGLNSDDQVRSFFINNGVSTLEYDKIVNSPAFTKALTEDEELVKIFNVAELPAIVVIKHRHTYYFSNSTLKDPTPENFVAMLNKLAFS